MSTQGDTCAPYGVQSACTNHLAPSTVESLRFQRFGFGPCLVNFQPLVCQIDSAVAGKPVS